MTGEISPQKMVCDIAINLVSAALYCAKVIMNMKTEQKLPDRKICKTKHICGVYYYCIVEERKDVGCAHAMSFGHSHICMHPDACWYDSESSGNKQNIPDDSNK